MIKARVNVETAKKNYAPGEVIREPLSAADMAFLKKHGFIIEESENEADTEDPDSEDAGIQTRIPGTGIPGEDGDDSGDGVEYKDEASLKKMNKDEIAAYGKSLGLDIAPEMLKNDMIDAVLNYIQEHMAEAE